MGQGSSTTAHSTAAAPVPNVQAGLLPNSATTPVPFMQAPFANGSPVFGLPAQQTPNMWQMQFAAQTNPQQPNQQQQSQPQNPNQNGRSSFPQIFNGQQQENHMIHHHHVHQQQQQQQQPPHFAFMPTQQQPAMPHGQQPPQASAVQQKTPLTTNANESKQQKQTTSNNSNAKSSSPPTVESNSQQPQQATQAQAPQQPKPQQQQQQQSAPQHPHFAQLSQQKFAQPIDLALPTPPKSFTPQFRPQIKGQQTMANAAFQYNPYPAQPQQQQAFNTQNIAGRPGVNYGAPLQQPMQQDYTRMYPYATCNQMYGFQNTATAQYAMPQQITQF